MKYLQLTLLALCVTLSSLPTFATTNYHFYCSCVPTVGGCSGLDTSRPCCRCYEPGTGIPTWDANSDGASIKIAAKERVHIYAYCQKTMKGPGKNHMDTSHDFPNIRCEHTFSSVNTEPAMSIYDCKNKDETPSTMHVNAFDCFVQ